MKKTIKLTAVLLCLAMLLTMSVGVSADDVSGLPDDIDLQSSTSSDEIIEDSNILDLSENKDISQNSTRSQATGIISGAVYRIKNIGSGKYMNVHNGVDANGTNIYQWTGDGSTEQKFRVVYFADSDSYLIYAMCSSNGSNRVVDVTRGSTPLTHGQNIKLYNPTDPTSQQFKIVSLGQNRFNIVMKGNTNLYLTSNGDSNGTSSGTSATSAGNIYIANIANSLYQHWTFELVESPPNPTGNLEEVSASRIKGWAYQVGLPDTPIDVHIYIKNNATGAQNAVAITANQYRADLYAAGKGDGYHAFDYTMDWGPYPSGTYTVSVYGINANGGTNPHLPNSPRTFTVRKATGTVDSLSSTGVSGWAWKPDAPNNLIQVHLYIRKLNGETVLATPTIANIYRPDLYAAGYGNGYHGYSIPIDWSTLPEEELQVTLYAVDGSDENPIFYDGYYNNAPAHGSITLYGIRYDNQPARNVYYTDAVRTAISNIGATTTNGIFTDTTNIMALDSMKNSMIWVVHTHGWKQGVCFNHFTEGETFLQYDHISALANNALESERCVIYGTCNAGEGREDAANMVNITHQKGAMTVIGWEGLTAVSQMNTWLEEFLVSSGEGKRIGDANTIGTAIYEAIVAVRSKHNNNLGGLADIYCAGSTTQMLIS